MATMDLAAAYLELVRPLLPRGRLALVVTGQPPTHHKPDLARLEHRHKERRSPTTSQPPMASLRLHFEDDEAEDAATLHSPMHLHVRFGRSHEYRRKRLLILACMAAVYVVLCAIICLRATTPPVAPSRAAYTAPRTRAAHWTPTFAYSPPAVLYDASVYEAHTF